MLISSCLISSLRELKICSLICREIMDGSNRLGFLIFTVLWTLNKAVVLFLVVFLFKGQNPDFLAIDVALYHFLFCVYFFTLFLNMLMQK